MFNSSLALQAMVRTRLNSAASTIRVRRLCDRRTFVAALLTMATAPARAAMRLDFSELVASGAFTQKARANAGAEVEMRGFMAPPLKPEINFFILTKLPAAVCPFCDSAAAWPDDIVLVQMARPIRAINYDVGIRVTGVLDIGETTDPVTGFVSLVRLRDARYVRA